MTFQVPKGYEEQIKTLVMTKIEGILSQTILLPTDIKRTEFQNEVNNALTKNNLPIKYQNISL